MAWRRPAELPYDLVIRNARIVDGTGSPWYRADIAIRGDTIARVAPFIVEPAVRVIDLGDLVAAPGFIDIHTHAALRDGIYLAPTADNYVRQGVTSIMVGPDGGGSVIIDGVPARLKPVGSTHCRSRSISAALSLKGGCARR